MKAYRLLIVGAALAVVGACNVIESTQPLPPTSVSFDVDDPPPPPSPTMGSGN